MRQKDSEPGYRPCVGVMLLNAANRVWVGRRFEKVNEEGIGSWWQMPQGGIDKGEDPRDAALRELYEETSVKSAVILAEAPGWFKYDIPAHLIGTSWDGRYRGQTQKWFALRFTGDESEIDLKPPGHKQEFDEWKWVDLDALPELIVSFKRPVYEQVVAAFRHLAG